jgi:DNA-binding transcriptional ArsR family regulator
MTDNDGNGHSDDNSGISETVFKEPDEYRPYLHPLHDKIVHLAKDSMPHEDVLRELADFFKVFGDTTRIKILHALSTTEMCVYDIAALLRMKQPAVSHQLRILKQSNLVKYKKEGKLVYYSLDDDHVKQIFERALVHISERWEHAAHFAEKRIK